MFSSWFDAMNGMDSMNNLNSLVHASKLQRNWSHYSNVRRPRFFHFPTFFCVLNFLVQNLKFFIIQHPPRPSTPQKNCKSMFVEFVQIRKKFDDDDEESFLGFSEIKHASGSAIAEHWKRGKRRHKFERWQLIYNNLVWRRHFQRFKFSLFPLIFFY